MSGSPSTASAIESIDRSTDHWEALLGALPMGFFVVGGDFRIRQINRLGRELFNVVPNALDRDFDEVIHALWSNPYADEAVRIFRHTLATGEPYSTPQLAEERRSRNLIEYYEWHLRRIPLPEGTHGVVCYFRDISARVRAEGAVRESRAETERQRRVYEAILSNTPDLAYVFDLNHRFTYANEGLLKMWGKSWGEAIGKNCLELGYPDWHAAMHDREIDHVVATRQPLRGEVPFSGTFGRRIYDYIFVPVFDAVGNVEAVAGTTRDVTERKASEVRNRFLVSLDDALRPLVDPHELTITAARILGEHLDVDRCAYADVDPDADTMNLIGNHVRGSHIKSIVGRMTFSDFGGEVLRQMRAGKPFVVHDIDRHEPSVPDKAAFRATQIQAVICTPLHKAGRLVATMAVHSAAPRRWTPEEVDLVQAVAARCWESIERARLERGLAETEGRFRSMADAVPMLVWVTDVTKACTWVNKWWREFTGRPLESLTGDGRLADVHPDDLRRWQHVYQRSFDLRQPFALDYRLRRKDGEYRWFFENGTPRFDTSGDFVGYVGSCVDITERRLAEEKLRRSEERFRAFVTTVSDVVYRMSADWGEMRQLAGHGFIADTPRPDRQWLHKYIHPDDHEMILQAIGDAIRHKSEFQLEHRVIRVDGSLGWTSSRAIPLRNAEGEITEWFGAATDITERRHAEIALRQAKEQAERASRAKDEFLAQLSHELRTPLTPVLMCAAELREDAALPAEVREQIGMIERNVGLEARLIDDLLDLTRITHGKLVMRWEPCDLHQLLRLVVEIVREDALEKRVEIGLDLATDRSRFTGDPARLQQVFWNLLGNAVKFTPEGGRIIVRTYDCPAADGSDGARDLCVDVTDNGIGFAPDSDERLFRPFEQGEVPAASRRAGLGLGLAIARAVVEMHHGRITAKSAGPHRGATFTVQLPAAQRQQTASNPNDAVSPAEGAPAKPLRLLLVEDHKPTLLVLNRLLTRAGHDVITAESVAAAKAAAEQNKFDAVISDVGLPDGTGIELMRHLRAKHGLKGIALSGYGMEEDLRRTSEAGFVAHLVKPVYMKEVRRVLSQLTSPPN